MNTDTIAQIDVTALYPHPRNPRIEPRQDIVEQLAERMANGFDPSHALIVRPLDSGYQVISGHHRLLAAERAGLSEVPCWVRPMDDADAYMQLVLCNTQSELHPLEEGIHALKSEKVFTEYAKETGKSRDYIRLRVIAAEVLEHATCVAFKDISDSWRNLAEIHAAPEWLWPALVAQMIDGEWTVATTRQMVGNYKTAEQPPEWCDAEAIAKSLLSGQLSIPDLAKLYSYPERVNVIDDDIRKVMWDDLRKARPSRLSDVQDIANAHEQQQAARLAEQRKAEADAQRQQEEAKQRVARLRKNCSLEEWKDLNDAERAMLQEPTPGEGGTFNQQKGDSIEWAQWSWNPVTGCKHECPYCYARDRALYDQKLKEFYINGWEPTFRSLSLNAPKNTKVPKEAATDSRYRNVFTCSMADLFGRWVPKEWIDAVMLAARGNPQWNFLFLTKFPQRFAEIDIPDNAWMGTTVDMQARVKNAEKAFANVKGGVRWLSVEPMIEPIRLERPDLFNWVVIGGASASKQTPVWQPPYRWIEALVRQCDEAGVPVYMKSNLGIANRVLQLPFDAPIKGDPQRAPEAFHYLGKAAA